MKKQINKIILLALVVVNCIFLTITQSSCKLSKKIFKANTDSSSVSKQDSGTVSKKNNTDFKKDDWWRETIVYPVRDCTINNTYIKPAVIYREGGSTTKVIDNTQYDSGWKNRYDSLIYELQTTDIYKKTDALNFWQIVAIGIGCSLVVGVIIFFLLKFKTPL